MQKMRNEGKVGGIRNIGVSMEERTGFNVGRKSGGKRNDVKAERQKTTTNDGHNEGKCVKRLS